MRYVYCHPLFDERKCAHRFSYQLQQTFQAAALDLERFDYRGTGEAPGEFADISLETLREDVVAQIRGDEVCLIGIRFGASLALDYCVRGTGMVSKLVLLEPVIDGTEYVDYLRRKQHIKNLMTGKSAEELKEAGYDNIEGFKTSVRFIEQINNLNLTNLAGEYALSNSVFIVHISNSAHVDQRTSTLGELLEPSAEQVLVESLQMPVFWERIPSADYAGLTEKVLGWCRD
ncbi:MAG: alpha/beta hydrolase family protein [Planctomycetota bacterium]|jgi:pimeloyl-ACP methyl ester carboxylesterase